VSNPGEPRGPESAEPDQNPSAPLPPESLPLDSTARLLLRVRKGDARAKELLMKRYLAALQRFAHGRLPAGARDLLDTQDLVQVTLIRALEHVERFEPQGPGSFHAYLRQALMNQIRDQARRVARSPERSDLPGDLAARERSPLEQAIGRDALERYESALARLSPEQQEAVVLRLELGFTYEEIAEAIGSPTANAARMLVTRALARLAEMMRDAGEGR
jgi:RNA polymerase sigma factor (sigma-70 family)